MTRDELNTLPAIMKVGDLEYTSGAEDIRQEGMVFTQAEYRLWVAQEWPDDVSVLTFDLWRTKHADLEDQIPEGL